MSSAQRAAAHSSVTSSGQGRSVHSPKAVVKVKRDASSVRSSVSAMRIKAVARCGPRLRSRYARNAAATAPIAPRLTARIKAVQVMSRQLRCRQRSFFDAALAANGERCFPTAWITPAQNNVTDDALAYFRPLIQGEPVIRMRGGLPEMWRL